MSSIQSYKVLLDLFQQIPKNEYEQKVNDFAGNILFNILDAKDAACFMVS
jgi:hypothetical protein